MMAEFPRKEPLLKFDRVMAQKKDKLRKAGYVYMLTLYGSHYSSGKMSYKRIEIMSKIPIRQRHSAYLSEVMVRQNLRDPTTKANHTKFPVLDNAKCKGAPKKDYLVLTMGELLTMNYEAEKGEWLEYDQET